MNNKYNKEDLERMILEEKLSYEEIGRKYGVSGAAIKKAAKKLGIELPSRRTINPKETFNINNSRYIKSDLEKYNKQGLSYSEIGKLYGVSGSSIFRIFKKFKIKKTPSKKTNRSPKITQEEFIGRAKEIHEDKYDYSEVEFTNILNKVKIYCKKCKTFFWQTPSDHIHAKAGCPKCGIELNSIKRSTGKEEFIRRSREKFGDKFDYSRVIYKSVRKKVEIYCKECKRYFFQSPKSHLSSKFGCPRCSNKYKNTNRLTKEDFIERAIKIHGNLYNYSKVNYIDGNTK